MNQERREQIAAALRQYREMVLQHNSFLLCTLVEKVEAQPAPPNCPESVAQELRMQAINELIEVPESIKLLLDVLDEGVISLLISSASLEGVDDDPVDPSLRREYFAGLKAKIEERGVEVAEFPPSDLEYLCTLFDFITPLRRGKMKDMMEAVGVPVRNDAGEVEHNQLTWLWEEWEIAIAFRIGGGPRGWGGSYALYCKNKDREQWKWRYGVHDEEWYSDVHENVEGLFGFYAHFNEQTEEELEDDITSLSALV
ncbi:hypothetical protein FOXG_10948 [Fusarium oxysporum f. sp. lycopersici 4287]|uniref:Uncharacterized protein n=3 Tax=Fusarium oxysporum TaxID=5507 RepID=A0A0J9VIB1_FUSO4|nr:hypothetical protein FOXG_10948 [Fusarium oxysporum f. sp. lycopersici 4287]EXK46441.1 hypothetical protein FOMG_00161 [Fusarium oxysporum f. sp. melonis 26406]KAJ9429729.1 hypothetical protein QL093DRAFT_2092916 [Fusarium oxysporum]KNB10828.1 hypothetical protein FOXG_10948 [Fusarium oxysporum f. sp. lycopersici 4287]